MKKHIKQIFYVVIFSLILCVLIMPNHEVGAANNDDITYDEVEIIGDKVLEYISVDVDNVYFDHQSAENNHEDTKVIEQGLLLESVSYRYSEGDGRGYSARAISVPVWGNYCGPGYGGKDSTKPAKDILDVGCKKHDQCYKWNLKLKTNCKCNKDLVKYIDANKNKMKGRMATVAWAIRTYFNTVGQLGC